MSAGRGRGPASRRQEGERRPVKFPRPRYKNVVILDPAHFSWLPIPDAAGVERKYMGSFTERGFWIEMIKIDAGDLTFVQDALLTEVHVADQWEAEPYEVNGRTAAEQCRDGRRIEGNRRISDRACRAASVRRRRGNCIIDIFALSVSAAERYAATVDYPDLIADRQSAVHPSSRERHHNLPPVTV